MDLLVFDSGRRRSAPRSWRRTRPSHARAAPRVPARLPRARHGRVRRRARWPTPCSTSRRAALAAHGGPVDAVGITNQRGSAVVWDRATGEPIGPGDRVAGPPHDRHAASSSSAPRLPVRAERRRPPRSRAPRHVRPRPVAATCASAPSTRGSRGSLTEGAHHVTDASNAGDHRRSSAATARGWYDGAARGAADPGAMLPDRRRHERDRRARRPRCRARRRSPRSSATSRRRSLGQACVRPGPAKITFGTGGMLDIVLGPDRPDVRDPRRRRHVPDHHVAARRRRHLGPRGDHARRPAPTWSGSATTSASSPSAEESHDVAQQCADTGGVVYVPALLGLGTPQWDFGARGTLLGLTRGSGRPADRARGARGRRAARRRPRRGGRDTTRATRSRCCASTAGCRATRRSCRPSPTRRRSRWRSRR